MNTLLTSFLLLGLTLVTVNATTHTVCYNYFMTKDKCVNSAAGDSLRCKVKAQEHSKPVAAFSLKTQAGSTPSRLSRRYNSNNPSFYIASGDGICKTYDSEEELGVCLWSGAEQTNPTLSTAGWLNGLKTSNCGKKVYIQRTGQPDTVQYAKVIDGCYFNQVNPENGCFEIGVTKKLFDKFHPTEEENSRGVLLNGLTWDFDNLFGNHSRNGPV